MRYNNVWYIDFQLWNRPKSTHQLVLGIWQKHDVRINAVNPNTFTVAYRSTYRWARDRGWSPGRDTASQTQLEWRGDWDRIALPPHPEAHTVPTEAPTLFSPSCTQTSQLSRRWRGSSHLQWLQERLRDPAAIHTQWFSECTATTWPLDSQPNLRQWQPRPLFRRPPLPHLVIAAPSLAMAMPSLCVPIWGLYRAITARRKPTLSVSMHLWNDCEGSRQELGRQTWTCSWLLP